MISLHTNAVDDDPTPRGTQVFYNAAQADGQLLASSIACYMREIITSQSGYQNWAMRATLPGLYAENSGSMPSALVEIAFHTNPDDARALQDPRSYSIHEGR